MNIRQLTCFVAVSEHLNFSRAAKQLYITQSAVSLQIQALEEEIGVRLFYRDNRNVELTPAGRSFLEDARAILRRSEDAVRRARQTSTEITGHLAFGFVKGYEKTNLSEMLSDFHVKYPNISLNLIRENVGELYDGILNHQIDYAVNLCYSMENLEQMQTKVLKKYPLLALMPSSHSLSHRTSIRRSELREYPLVDIKKNENRYGEKSTITKAFADAGFLPHIVYTSDDIETSILAVATGIGYALMPSYITDAIPAKEKVVAIPIEGEEEKMTVVGAWMKENKNPALQVFLQELGLQIQAEKRIMETDMQNDG